MMSVDEHEVSCIITALPEGAYLGEVLFYNGIRSFAEASSRAQDRVLTLAEQLAKRANNAELFQRIEVAKPSVREVRLELAPRHGLIGWDKPVDLALPVVSWQETTRHHIGYLPSLGIEVVGVSEQEMLERAESHARLLINRMRITHDLKAWARLASLSEIGLEHHRIQVETTTPLQAVKQDNESKKQDEPSELKRSASELSQLKLDSAYEVDRTAKRLAESLATTHRRPVLLVGPSGVGKTAAIHEFARQRQRFNLGTRQIWQTDGPRLVAGMTGFGMWQERCGKVIEEVRKSDAILFLGNLVQLMQVGQHEGNEQGIASFFKPYLMRGEFHAIAECTEEQRKLIELQDPNLLSLFEEIHMQEPEQAARRRILHSVAVERGRQSAVKFSDDAIRRIDDLHQRFATYSVSPGRPVRFLKNLIQSTQDKASVGPGDVTRAFANETGLPLFMIDESVAFEPDQTRSWFGTRVIGQSEAIGRVTDVLTVVKANLSRPNRPIGSLLFIGPTGVGKTQMAKTLAEYLFGDAERMARFDMSEYSNAAAVTRLTQAPFSSGCAMAIGEGLLTAKVREQPFSVLLFDEIEKAHPSFFDLLLQVLGEGRLTDGAGRLADFTNTVIIMTSNLGAQAFQADHFGFAAGDAADQSVHFIEAVRDAVRPELFNRIDRIVPFDPLGREQVRSIVARELDQIRQRDGLALRNTELDVDHKAIDLLVEQGFDAKLGARPLQRAIEQRVLAPLADQMNQYGRDTALRARVTADHDCLRVEVGPAQVGQGKTSQASITGSPIASNLRLVIDLRRKAQKLVSCSSVIELRNEVVRLQRIHERRANSKRSDAWTDPEMHMLPRLEAVLEQIEGCRSRVEAAEDDLSSRLYTGVSNALSASEVGRMTKEVWRQTLLDIYCRRFKSADELLVAVYGDVPEHIYSLIEAYRHAVAIEGASVECAPLFMWRSGDTAKPKGGVAIRKIMATADEPTPREFPRGQTFVWRDDFRPITEPLTSLSRHSTFGMILRVKGPHVAALLAAEAGIHRFRSKAKVGNPCYVDTSGASIDEYRPPHGIEVLSVEDACEGTATRRVYDTKSSTVDDKVLDKRTGWSLERGVQTLLGLITESREKLLEDMIRS